MPTLTTQKDLQAVRGLPFCYACGADFDLAVETDRDHVPPKACFAVADRTSPLILPTHRQCNASFKTTDETLGQLISLRHRRTRSPKSRRLEVGFVENPMGGRPMAFFKNVEIRGEIERWLRAFHAALYREPLPIQTGFGIETPFPVAVPSSRGIVVDKFREHQHREFVRTIKDNRSARNLDRIASNNSKLLYECVWDQATNGRWVCIFGLDLYGWKHLGAANGFAPRGCAGFYMMPSGEVPVVATRAMRLQIRLPNYDPLDPFGC